MIYIKSKVIYCRRSISLSNLQRRYAGYRYRPRHRASYEDGITGSNYLAVMHHTRQLRYTDVSRFYVNAGTRDLIEISNREMRFRSFHTALPPIGGTTL